MQLNQNQQVFFKLVRAGLWEKEARLSQYQDINYSAILQLAEEQSVVGLVTAGLENVVDIKVPKEVVLLFAGGSLQIEQRNQAMNDFIAKLIGQLRKEGLYVILLKGQGIAQCYIRPLWRTCGDVDLFFNQKDYEKAKTLLIPMASYIEEENKKLMHLALKVSSFVVELHGTLHGGLSKRERLGLMEIKKENFEEGNVRFWLNGKTQVFLPGVDNDILIVYTHILEHFFYGGIGLRQICDWCRLLWTYRESINHKLLERRLEEMGLKSEWMAFAALAVNELGMPVEAMPLFSDDKKWIKKANRIREIILETGNFGHNKDSSHYQKYSFTVYKAISLWRNTKESFSHMMIFPVDAARVWFYRLGDGVNMALRGK